MNISSVIQSVLPLAVTRQDASLRSVDSLAKKNGLSLLLSAMVFSTPGASAEAAVGERPEEAANRPQESITYWRTEISKEFRENWSERAKGVKIHFPKEIRMKNNRVNLSSFTEQLKRAQEMSYYYDDFFVLQNASNELLDNHVLTLCSKSQDPDKCLEAAEEDLDVVLESVHQKTNKRILYPSLYTVLSEQSEETTTRLLQNGALSLSAQNCREACASGPVAEALTQLPKRFYRELLEKIKKRGRSCLRKALDTTLEELEAQSMPKACTEKENKNHAVCKTILKDTEDLQNRIADLAEAAYGTDRESAMEAAAPCFSCSLEGNEKTINPFLLNYKNWEEAESCYSLKPGEEKPLYSGEPMRASYILKRDSRGDYSISFPLEFAAAEDYDGSVPAADVPGEYRKKVQSCLKEADKNLTGPQGEKLKLLVTKPEKPSEKTTEDHSEKECKLSDQRKTVIDIGSSGKRSNSKKYASDIDCALIVHEVLHLAGLCDEYREKKSGFWTDPENGEVIGANFGSDKMKKKPEGAVFQAAYDCRVTAGLSIMGSHWKMWKSVKDGDSASLLTPGQFQKLLFGQCSGKNKLFNECSLLSYQSSQEDGDECLKAKERCEKRNGLGLDKQTETKAWEEEIKKLKTQREEIRERMRELQEQGEWNRTKRDDLNEASARYKHLLASVRTGLGKAVREANLREEEDHRRWIRYYEDSLNWLAKEKVDYEERGDLDETLGKIEQKQLNQTEALWKAAEKRLRIVQSWPD